MVKRARCGRKLKHPRYFMGKPYGSKCYEIVLKEFRSKNQSLERWLA